MTQWPGRIAAFAGTLAALALFVVAVVLATAAVDLGVSILIAAVEGQPTGLPAWGELACSSASSRKARNWPSGWAWCGRLCWRACSAESPA